ncbi:hypothetical protein CDD82_4953 [Ophiocordyceps australis]|uniref:Aminoglycoside phosphotransferase domain-containing protein n=1 Tax=Ophiocordyceps australis TaxID=1399860 RepID=A0A2C5XJ87_9HYPO|nr:hypothetical protein CDD82_4953 [Ophiocordyceps australis]
MTPPEHIAHNLLTQVHLRLVSCTELQSLWADYGHICAIEARDAADKRVPLILKLISPPSASRQEEGHLRKVLSYQVEQYFYTHIAPRLPPDVPVATCLASTQHQHETAMLLTDLRPRFPLAAGKRELLSPRQVDAVVDWLAIFHASSAAFFVPASPHAFVLPPLQEAERKTTTRGLWLNGGYTYLATRRSEYASLAADEQSEWSAAFCSPFDAGSEASVAELAATFLTPCGRSFESLIHGDVKSENLFSTTQGDAVALFDFQYVGLGLGVCDLAKLFTCSVPPELLHVSPAASFNELPMSQGEEALLKVYLDTFASRHQPPIDYDWNDFVRHWETALVDWCRFQASWGFWGNTDWLQARVRLILKDNGWRDWIRQQAQQSNTKNKAQV